MILKRYLGKRQQSAKFPSGGYVPGARTDMPGRMVVGEHNAASVKLECPAQRLAGGYDRVTGMKPAKAFLSQIQSRMIEKYDQYAFLALDTDPARKICMELKIVRRVGASAQRLARGDFV